MSIIKAKVLEMKESDNNDVKEVIFCFCFDLASIAKNYDMSQFLVCYNFYVGISIH